KLAALGFLVAGVAHEINNPASFTHTTVYNLQRDIENLKTFLVELAGNDADAEILAAFDERFSVLFNHLATLNEGTTRITKTVSDLRTFYRKEKEEMIPIKLLDGLQVTANLVKTHFKEQVEFVYDFQADPEIEGTASELNQVFMNVMINACQAIKEKQKVTGEAINGILNIRVLIEKDKAVIRFKDNGIGMSHGVRNKMFDPFFTTRSMGEGTGLGLFISYGIVKKHNGRFEVVSEEGKGTTINLYLPLKSNNNSKKEYYE
ncbi:MAG TPA: ATP-binding protein, partial [Candidatus Kapabacteria bacterium]|nr:ATP-binding protein [Candidatus Kapabacteria bacterium]